MELTAAIAMLRGDDDGAKARAAYALWNLMQDSSGGLDRTYLDNKVAIREAGCIPLLVALLERDPHPFYTRALETLAWNQAENKVAILESGVVPMLVALVKMRVFPVSETVAAAFIRAPAPVDRSVQRDATKAPDAAAFQIATPSPAGSTAAFHWSQP